MKTANVGVQRPTSNPAPHLHAAAKRPAPAVHPLVFEAVARHVPEVRDGTITVVATASGGAGGAAGEVVKVAVASDTILNPAATCIGRGADRARAVSKTLGKRVEFVCWTPNAAEFVRRAMEPARVVHVTVTQDGTTATVYVAREDVGGAIGRRGENVTAAVRLTGVRISVQPLPGGVVVTAGSLPERAL